MPTSPAYPPTVSSQNLGGVILHARVYFAKASDSVTSSAMPIFPPAEGETSPWESRGQIKDCTPTYDIQSLELIGAGDSGGYEKKKMRLIQGLNLKYNTQYIHEDALGLSFAAAEGKAYWDSSAEEEGWLVMVLTNAYGKKELATISFYGTNRLANPLKMGVELATAEWDFDAHKNEKSIFNTSFK